MTIAALFVESDGVYARLPDVDVWGVERDARNYRGPWPVVAHPPCAPWSQLASVNAARWGSPIGRDNGEFAAALAAVRRYGGILEHPAYSLAWAHYGLPRPIRHCWTTDLFLEYGMTTEVSQCAYGHPARKRTWLYAVGIDPVELNWTEPPVRAVVGAGIHRGQSTWAERASPDDAIGTPVAFRDTLVALARSATVR